MKTVTAFLISILCLQIEGYLIKVPTSTVDTRVATGGLVHIQRLLLPLFENVCELSVDPVIVRLNEDFKLDPSNGVYLNPDVVENFQNLKAKKAFLAKGEIFTEYNPDHLNELKVIYELLYYARDFDTFYRAACWARQNLNCGLFVDAIYLAVLNRRDTEKVTIPAPYEILPNYFVRKDFVIKASSLMRGETVALSDDVRNEGNSYVLDVNNVTGFYRDSDDELAYFHEDIGLNSYYFLTKLNNVPWLSESQRKIYGQYLYHTMKQLAARYNLERYSNGLEELETIDWDNIVQLSYDSMLIYSNGDEFSQRISSNVGSSEILTSLKNIEDNLQPIVVHMRDGGYDKSAIMNHLMEILVTSEKSYWNLALQYITEDRVFPRSPSVLEHYMTSVRDPLFWKLNKKIVDLVDEALQVLPSYSTNELYFPGVEIQNIEVKKFMTMFDYFKFDVTSALKTENEDSKFEVKIGQSRLNHKPFSFKIAVASLVAQKALVKIYIGPKVLPGQLIENKNLFMLMDNFEVNLKIGSNLLSRNSNEMINLSDDLLSLETLQKIVLDSEFGINVLPLKSVWSQIGFPSRLILPKGTIEGLPISVFVFIAPYVKATVGGPRPIIDLNTDAILSPGYPFDLNIEIQQLFNLPNAMVKDITITHKSENIYYNKPVNTYNSASNDRSWSTDSSDSDTPRGLLYLSFRPEFTKRSFDYKSKQNQFGRKTDYSAKRGNYRYQIKRPEDTNVEVEEHKTDSYIEPEKVEVINNIYINRENNVNQDLDMDKTLIKSASDNIPIKLNEIENNSKDSEKLIDVNSYDIKDVPDPETLKVINNVYVNPEMEDIKVSDVKVDETKTHNVFVTEKDENQIDDTLLDIKSGKTENDDYDKDIEIKNANVKPHGLLTMPRRKLSNVFNIIYKPSKTFESKKRPYEKVNI